MDGTGLLKVIDALGNTIAALESANARLAQRVQELEAEKGEGEPT